MFCTNCGNQLPDGTRFCIHCGTPQAAAPAEEAPVLPVEEAPIVPPVEKTVPAEALTEDSILDAVVTEGAVYQSPFYEAPAAAPAEEAPVYEAPAYTDIPVPPVPKKKKKTGVIIAAVLVLVLLAGAAVGVFFYLDHKNSLAYDDALALLEAGKVNEALAAFEDLGDYEDAADMVDDLKAYQKALKLLDEHKYDDALKEFKALGKFHDSKTYVSSGVDYHKATYILDCADKRDPAGLELTPYGNAAVESGDDRLIAYDQYLAAAAMFEDLDDYLNSAELASKCWYEAALIDLERGNVEEAMRLQEKLNSDDSASLQSQMEACSADVTVLTDLETALTIWMDNEDEYTIGEETEKAYEHLELYGDLFFLDSRLEELYWDFMDSLEDQLDTTDADGYVDDWVAFYQATADMYYVCDRLNEEYGFLSGSELEELFIGYYETAAKYPAIEKSLTDQFSGVTAPWSAEGYYYAPYTNDTGYDIILYYNLDFYLGDECKETTEDMELPIPAGETVEIPLVPTTLTDDDWDGWTINWVFDIT